MMLAKTFSTIMDDKGLTISVKVKDDNCATLTINPLHLDEICGEAVDNGLDFFYDTHAIANHTMDVDVYKASKKLNAKQYNEWVAYLAQRDKDNGQPYSWYSITCNDYDHKDGLEQILGLQLFSMEVEEYQEYIA